MGDQEDAEREPTPKPHRQRHDGFTPKKQRKFFKALKKTGCLSDAARAAGISRNTVRRHRNKWPAFDAKVAAALKTAAGELDAIAWKRATEGAEEKVYREGRLVMTRVKPSDAMLRLLLQGANPAKYGRTGQLPKAAVMDKLRREVRAELRGKFVATEAETIAKLQRLLAMLKKRRELAAREREEGGEE
jgi:hypothetical protein